MVRECRPPAREPVSSWLGRRSTMATSTPANANSPANISPVGPPPAITTAWLVIAALQSLPRRRSTRPRATSTSTTIHSFLNSVGSGFGRRFYGMTGVLKQAPYAPHIEVGGMMSFCGCAASELDGHSARTTPRHGSVCRHRQQARAAKAASIGKSAPCEILPPKRLPLSKTNDWPASGVDSSRNLAGDRCLRILRPAAPA
jgi:hypothetical protein